jgi:hypothetical protein
MKRVGFAGRREEARLCRRGARRRRYRVPAVSASRHSYETRIWQGRGSEQSARKRCYSKPRASLPRGKVHGYCRAHQFLSFILPAAVPPSAAEGTALFDPPALRDQAPPEIPSSLSPPSGLVQRHLSDLSRVVPIGSRQPLTLQRSSSLVFANAPISAPFRLLGRRHRFEIKSLGVALKLNPSVRPSFRPAAAHRGLPAPRRFPGAPPGGSR